MAACRLQPKRAKPTRRRVEASQPGGVRGVVGEHEEAGVEEGGTAAVAALLQAVLLRHQRPQSHVGTGEGGQVEVEEAPTGVRFHLPGHLRPREAGGVPLREVGPVLVGARVSGSARRRPGAQLPHGDGTCIRKMCSSIRRPESSKIWRGASMGTRRGSPQVGASGGCRRCGRRGRRRGRPRWTFMVSRPISMVRPLWLSRHRRRLRPRRRGRRETFWHVKGRR